MISIPCIPMSYDVWSFCAYLTLEILIDFEDFYANFSNFSNDVFRSLHSTEILHPIFNNRFQLPHYWLLLLFSF